MITCANFGEGSCHRLFADTIETLSQDETLG